VRGYHSDAASERAIAAHPSANLMPARIGRTAWRIGRRRAARGLGQKHLAELEWWKRALAQRVAWYSGESTMHGRPPPTPDGSLVGAAIETKAALAALAVSLDRYPEALKIGRSHFSGKTILDLGCGPYPLSLAFEDCRIVGLDPLIRQYEDAGFPLSEFTDRITFVCGFAEEMPFASQSFDAVISVNAIDHVDDFARAAREVSRVLKKNGVLRMQVHYHRPTKLEPWALNDEEVLAHLGHLGIEKVSEEVPSGHLRLSEADPDERLVVWANDV
jgi:SAM-dependent methyltransferase